MCVPCHSERVGGHRAILCSQFSPPTLPEAPSMCVAEKNMFIISTHLLNMLKTCVRETDRQRDSEQEERGEDNLPIFSISPVSSQTCLAGLCLNFLCLNEHTFSFVTNHGDDTQAARIRLFT